MNSSEGGLFPQHTEHGLFLKPHNHRRLRSLYRGNANLLPCKTGFAKETAWLEQGDDGLFSLLGYDRQLHFPLLEVEHRIPRIALGEDDLILGRLEDGSPLSDLREEGVGVKASADLSWHNSSVVRGLDLRQG